jgi:hypothetical protein
LNTPARWRRERHNEDMTDEEVRLYQAEFSTQFAHSGRPLQRRSHEGLAAQGGLWSPEPDSVIIPMYTISQSGGPFHGSAHWANAGAGEKLWELQIPGSPIRVTCNRDLSLLGETLRH